MSTTILTFTPTQVYSDRMAHTKSTESNRHLVLLDIENLAGTPDPTWSEIEYAKRQLDAVIPDFSSARCIVASSHIGAEVICFSFPKALRRLRSGPDGADLALIDEVLDDRLMARFTKVTLCSGDGIFAPHVARLGRLGVEVTVVAQEGSLSTELRLAADHVVELVTSEIVEPVVIVRRAS